MRTRSTRFIAAVAILSVVPLAARSQTDASFKLSTTNPAAAAEFRAGMTDAQLINHLGNAGGTSGEGTGVNGINLYEFTVGLGIKPFAKDRWGQYLQIRPEIRWDLSQKNVFNDFADDNQFTFGVDVLYAF